MQTAVGFLLPPDEATLALLEPLILEDPDYYEVAPETLWALDESGALTRNGYHKRFEDLRRRTGRPFVAHGVGYSPGGISALDAPRRAAWREQIAETHAAFGFLWYSDHLGATVLDGRSLALPLPVPMLAEVADLIRGRLLELQSAVPLIALENSAFYYLLGEPLEEPGFLKRALDAPGLHQVLDLHNLHVNSINLGFDPEEWLARFPLEKVIEIHLAGGVPSDPAWISDGSVFQLDSHDASIPEAVWRLYAEVVPRCPGLRGVTLERMEGTLTSDEVPLLREELRRARSGLR